MTIETTLLLNQMIDTTLERAHELEKGDSMQTVTFNKKEFLVWMGAKVVGRKIYDVEVTIDDYIIYTNKECFFGYNVYSNAALISEIEKKLKEFAKKAN